MKNIVHNILLVLTVALAFAMATGVASAQLSEDEVFTTNYFSNNTTPGAPPATLRFTEYGVPIVAGNGQPYDTDEECAMIYVYAADQQLTECCGCPVTNNGLVHENVQKDLLGNPLTRVTPNEGVIQIVSGAYLSVQAFGICDPTDFDPVPEIESWVTHIQNKVGSTFPITEGKGDEEVLTSNQLSTLESDCAGALRLGSGFGVCSCNQEATK